MIRSIFKKMKKADFELLIVCVLYLDISTPLWHWVWLLTCAALESLLLFHRVPYSVLHLVLLCSARPPVCLFFMNMKEIWTLEVHAFHFRRDEIFLAILLLSRGKIKPSKKIISSIYNALLPKMVKLFVIA